MLASPSDTVTGPKMAIEMALAGGMGIIHANQSIEQQVEMVKAVKRFVSGFILEPFVMGPTQSLADLDALKEAKGVSSVPITSDGQLAGRLVGLVTSRDADRCEDRKEFLCRAFAAKAYISLFTLRLEHMMYDMYVVYIYLFFFFFLIN